MEDIIKVTKGIESSNEMIEKLKKTVNELESLRDSSLPNNTQWVDIHEHFNVIKNSLKDKLHQIEEKGKQFTEKQSEARRQMLEREAAVAKKELSSLDHLQELKDKAVSAIEEARKNCKFPDPVLVNVKASKDNKNNKVSTSDYNNEENQPDNDKNINNEDKLRPQVKEFCKQMNPKGLLKLFSENRKFLTTVIEDLPTALKSATDPGRFILDSLEGFYPPEPTNSQESEVNALQFLRRTCLTLMECASSLLREDKQNKNNEIKNKTKERAKAIADEWNTKLTGIDIEAARGYSLEAAAFLQLLVTFNIAEKFHEDELCKLVFAITRRRQTPELCRALGLTHRMPGMVETLVKTGRQIDAVHFAYAFQLTENFPPVPLLKDYLDNIMANISEIANEKEANNKEMGALKVISKCIEEYSLQDQYPVEPLKKKIGQLEKAKYEKKRSQQQQASKPQQSKKARANGAFTSEMPMHAPPPVYDRRAVYSSYDQRHTDRYPYHASPAYDVAPYPASLGYDRVAPYGYQSTAPTSYAGTGYQTTVPAIYAGTEYQTTALASYVGTEYPTGTANYDYSSYMGTAAQSASSAYGSYTSAVAPGAPHLPHM